jgi:Kelch motif protein/galactose oxidase-like protein
VPVFLFSAIERDAVALRRTLFLLEEYMEEQASLSNGAALPTLRSAVAVSVFLLGMLYGVICQAQILGTGSLNSARRGHTVTLLQDGKILIVGGDDANGVVGQAEILDPVSLTSSNIAANPIAPRTDHTATLLSDGRVLIIGGVDQNGLMSSTEFYNPYAVPAPSFSAGPSLMRGRSGHTATILADGKILIVGGVVGTNTTLTSAEIYDPQTQTFSTEGPPFSKGTENKPEREHRCLNVEP